MKAVVIRRFGGFDVLEYEDIEPPLPEPGHILIKVLAAGINRLDHCIREGSIVTELTFPHILGADAAGEVAGLGAGVTDFEIGERVVPLPGYPADDRETDVYPNSAAPSYILNGLQRPGTYAQYMLMPARWVLKDGTGLSPEEVATLPVAGATAARAVKVVGEVKAGDRVLVTAGASGVGTFEVQAAKALGAEVAATVRDDVKGEVVSRLGADLLINTRREDFVKRVMKWTDGRGADVVIDNVGGDFLPRAIDAAKLQGIIVAVGFVAGKDVTFDIRNFFFSQKQLRGSLGGDKTDLEWVLDQVRTGRVKPVLDRALALSRAAEAHRLISANRAAGNIVLLPWSEQDSRSIRRSTAMTESKRYVTLTDETFQSEVLERAHPVVVDFWADWCGPCHIIAPAIEALASKFEGQALVGKLDVDANPETAETYHIRSIPTILFFKDGKVVDQVVGVVSKTELANRLEKLLAAA